MKLFIFAELLAVFFKFSCCFLKEVQKKEHCILPNITDRSHPCGYQQTACKNSCALLSDYTRREFSNVKLTFYEGTHYLYEVWELSGGSNLVFSARTQGKVKVECKAGESGIKFSNYTQVLLEGIEFISCGISNIAFNKFHNRAALLFVDMKDLSLQAIKILEPSTAGGISLNNARGNIFINNSQFHNAIIPSKNFTSGNFIGYNKCHHGSTILTITNSSFENNTYTFDKKCIIDDNHLATGLSLVLKCLDLQIRLFNVTLRKNTGCAGGNMAILYLTMQKKKSLVNSTVTIAQKSVLEEGQGNVGGGLLVILVHSRKKPALVPVSMASTSIPQQPIELFVMRDTRIINNTGLYVGGGVFIKHLEGLKHITDGVVRIIGCHFEGNLKKGKNNGGYAIHFTTFDARGYEKHYRPQLEVNVLSCSFSNHGKDPTENLASKSPKYGDAVIFIKASPYLGISKTNIVDNACSGLTAINSNVVLSDTINISNNTAYSGGGILLCDNARLYFKQQTHLIITGNHAEHTGGGIFVETECVLNIPVCFFQISSYVYQNMSLLHTLDATVIGNTANYSGDNIYGGYIDSCNLINSKNITPYFNFFQLFNITMNSHEHNSSIASSPRKVCILPHQRDDENNITCNLYHEISIYPGQTFSIDVAIHGQHSGLVPGTVYARLDTKGIYLGQGNYIQALPSLKHRKMTYRVFSKKQNVQAQLYLSVEEEGATHTTTNVTLNIKACPFGFTLDPKGSESACRCTHLQEYAQVKGMIECSISENIWIKYHPRLWIGSVDDETTATKVIALCIICPRDFCKTGSIILPLEGGTFNNTLQCAFNRSGVLCGACTEGNSMIFGSSKCRKCSNFTLLLIFFFAFAGLALVLFIAFLNLTVSAATLNGIIFYANIIQIYSFFIFNEKSSFLKVFISWLNLDFGIDLCFFDGMNGLSKALLQFVFPTYLWFIAGAIILLSKRYKLMLKLFGSNTVQVLATIILLSYTKIIRASTDAIHCTRLLQPTYHSFHWSMDGNLKFFEGNHILVFTVGALFGILSLPFSIILLCISPLLRISNWTLFSWINRLKPFFDCYTGVLSNRGRFWVGLLLSVRIVLLVVYSYNISSSEVMKMTATVIVTLFLLLSALLFSKGVYSKHYLNVLECFSIANLGLLFTCLLCCYYYNFDSAKRVVVMVSVGICFISFVLVIFYHVYQKLRRYRFSKWAPFKRLPNHHYSHGNSRVMEHPPYFEFNEDREPLLAM